jgi:hypothetical protein|tara:strand:- start:1774 stop:1905 length:132 start_codon:yes stop_codon:yes gene_type:complete
MSKWNKKDWAEYGLMFLFLSASVIILGFAGALVLTLLEELRIL